MVTDIRSYKEKQMENLTELKRQAEQCLDEACHRYQQLDLKQRNGSCLSQKEKQQLSVLFTRCVRAQDIYLEKKKGIEK